MSTAFNPRMLERYIAIDRACGWPNLTLLPNGDIAAIIWPEVTHGRWEGAAECWGSADGGRTWAKRGVPVPHEPGTNRMNVSAGLARDGALVTIVSGWENRPPRGTYAELRDNDTIPPLPARSLDGGCTWELGEAPVAIAEEHARFAGGRVDAFGRSRPMMIPFGDIQPLPEGTLGSMFYSGRPGFYVSSDDGRSWTHRGALGEFDRHNETTWLPLSDRRLLAAVRTVDAAHLEQFISPDLGATWAFDQVLTEPGHYPAGLTRLADGAILLTYGIRTEPLYGVGARLSRDEGRTWSEPRVLVDTETSTNPFDQKTAPYRDGGYPSNVQLADGTIVTAYYCKGIPAHQRYHVGVVRWTL